MWYLISGGVEQSYDVDRVNFYRAVYPVTFHTPNLAAKRTVGRGRSLVVKRRVDEMSNKAKRLLIRDFIPRVNLT